MCGLSVARDLGDLVDRIGRELADAGIESARLDARLLIAHATARNPDDVLLRTDGVITDEQRDRLESLVRRRKAREPMSHLLGIRGFYDLEFATSAAVLTPRPETETLVDVVLDRMPAGEVKSLRVLDLGTGSGCLVLTLLNAIPGAVGVATDISPDALAMASANAERTDLADRVQFLEGVWFEALDETSDPFDVIVGNPPYIPTGDLADLEPEVREYEPHVALDGGTDGLDAYRAILAQAVRYVRPSGLIAVEVGIGQAASVSALMHESGMTDVQVTNDLGGIGRVVSAVRPVG